MPKSNSRPPLSPDRILTAAIELADEEGIDALVIRALAKRLDVKPMAIYHHLPNKDAILDGIVDAVYAEFEVPDIERDGDWRTALERRCRSARQVFKRHPWAVRMLESRRQPGHGTLHHLDAMIGTLRSGGFSVRATAHALALIDAYVYGYSVQEATLPFEGGEEAAALATEIMAEFPSDAYPNMAAFVEEHVLQPGYDFADEFEVGLRLVLDSVATLLNNPSRSGPGSDRNA